MSLCTGRAIAQVVSCRISNAVARVRAQIKLFGLCGGQSGSGAGLLRVLRFPLSILIQRTAPHSSSSSIIRGWYDRPIVADVLSGLSLTHPKKPKQEMLLCNFFSFLSLSTLLGRATAPAASRRHHTAPRGSRTLAIIENPS
jgi:hypothetical protein